MGSFDPPPIPLKMAARASVTMSGTVAPPRDPRDPRVYGPRHGQIKMGSQTRDPITSLERSGRLLLFRGHRFVLRLNRLAFFEGND
jgi:hypothetical protein